MAKIIKKSFTSTSGMVFELIGFVLLFVFPIGTIIGIIFIIQGSAMSFKCVCSNCGNKVDDKKVKICPTCKERFE